MNSVQDSSHEISVGHRKFYRQGRRMERGAIGTRQTTAGINQRERHHHGTGRLQRPARDYAGEGVKRGQLPAGLAERCGRYLLQPGERFIKHTGVPAVRCGRRVRCRTNGRRRRYAAGSRPDDLQNPALGAGHGLDHRGYVFKRSDPHAV